MVHGFIQQFIDNHKIVSNGFLFQRAEVVFKDLTKPKEKRQYQSHIGIPGRHSAHVKIVLLDFDYWEETLAHVVGYTAKFN